MGNRIFVAVVIGLWAATMTWLMVARILPPFFQGEPPHKGRLISDLVCWEIRWDDAHVGYAIRQAVPGAQSTTEVHSRVLIEDIPLRDLAPQWMRVLVQGLGPINMDCRSRHMIDSLGRLSSFHTSVRLNDMPGVIKVSGQVDGSAMDVRITTGDVAHEMRYPLPEQLMLGNELIPEPKLLNIYVGRKWRQEVFSPFRPPNDSMEILLAEVVEEKQIAHGGEYRRARKIEYRGLSPAGVSADNTLRAVLWVAEDGAVLRQEVYILNAKLQFERSDDPTVLAMAEDLLNLETVATLGSPEPSP